MRRTDKEIIDLEQLSDIISKCLVCRLGLARENVPYILPVSFGYDGDAVYFHTAREGRKLEFLSTGSTICCEFEHSVRLVPHETNPCDWTFSFQSVIGYGTVRELTDPEEKSRGLHHVMRQYSGRTWDIRQESMDAVLVWKVAIETLTGKQSKDNFAV